MAPSTDADAMAILSRTPPTPIAKLHPEILPAAENASATASRAAVVVRGEITLKWPYNSVTNTLAFLLAEPDVLLRRAGGQVRVQLSGPSAKAVADAGVGAGDEALFSLEGVRWAKDDAPGRVPGARLEWQLQFSERLLLQVKLGETGETKVIDVDHPEPAETQAPEEEPVHIPALELSQPELLSQPETPASKATPAMRRILDLEEEEYASPAFMKRARVSYGSLFEGGLDIFEDDGGIKGRGRKRARFSLGRNSWRYTSQSPSPEPEQAPETEQEDYEMEEAPPEPEVQASSPTPRPHMADEGCQTTGEIDAPSAPSVPAEMPATPAQELEAAEPLHDQPEPPSMPPPDACLSESVEEAKAEAEVEAEIEAEATATAIAIATTAEMKSPVTASSSLFGIFGQSDNDFSVSRFGGFAPQTSPGLSIADQVRFQISHEPQMIYAPIPEPVPEHIHEHEHEHVPEPVHEEAVSGFGGQEAYPLSYLDSPPSQHQHYDNVKSYPDIPEHGQGPEASQGSLTDLTSPIFVDHGLGDMPTHSFDASLANSGHFGANIVPDENRVATGEPELQPFGVDAGHVPAGFHSYGDSANNTIPEGVGEEAREPAPTTREKTEQFEARDFVSNRETHADKDDDHVAVDDEDDAEYDEDGDELQEGDYDQRVYDKPADDDDGSSEEEEHKPEPALETGERYDDEEDRSSDEEESSDEDEEEVEGEEEELEEFDEEWGSGEEGDYDEEEEEDESGSEGEGYAQGYPAPPRYPHSQLARTSGFMKPPSSKVPEVIDLISDSDESEDDSSKKPPPPSRPAPAAARPPPPPTPSSLTSSTSRPKASAVAENAKKHETPVPAPNQKAADQPQPQPVPTILGTGQTVVIDFATKFYPDFQQSTSTNGTEAKQSGSPQESPSSQAQGALPQKADGGSRPALESESESESGSEIEYIDDNGEAMEQPDRGYDEEGESEEGEGEFEVDEEDGFGEEDEEEEEEEEFQLADEAKNHKKDGGVEKLVRVVQQETHVIIDDDEDEDDEDDTDEAEGLEDLEYEEDEEEDEATEEVVLIDDSSDAPGKVDEVAGGDHRIDEADGKSRRAEITDAVESYPVVQAAKGDMSAAEVKEETTTLNAAEPTAAETAESRAPFEVSEPQLTGQEADRLQAEPHVGSAATVESESRSSVPDDAHQPGSEAEATDQNDRQILAALSPPPTQNDQSPELTGKEGAAAESQEPDEMSTALSPSRASHPDYQEAEHLPSPLATQVMDDQYQPEPMLVEEKVEMQVMIHAEEMELGQTPSAAPDEMSIDADEPQDQEMTDGGDFRPMHDQAEARGESADEEMGEDTYDTPRPIDASSPVPIVEMAPGNDIEIMDADENDDWDKVIEEQLRLEAAAVAATVTSFSGEIEPASDVASAGPPPLSTSQLENTERPTLEIQDNDAHEKQNKVSADESIVDAAKEGTSNSAEDESQTLPYLPIVVPPAIAEPVEAEAEHSAAAAATLGTPQSSLETAMSPRTQASDQAKETVAAHPPANEDGGEESGMSMERGRELAEPEEQQQHRTNSPELSLQFARHAVVAERRDKTPPQPLRTSPRFARSARSSSLQMSLPSSDPADGDGEEEDEEQDNSMSLARAALCSPSKRSSAADSDSTTSGTGLSASGSAVSRATATALRNELRKRLRAELKDWDCVPLRSLRSHVDKTLSVVVVAVAPPAEPPVRARQGPREFFLPLRVTDPSLAPASGVVEAQLFRPYTETLPVVRAGDALLLRNFRVVALPGKGFGLRSCEDSAWAVFEAGRDTTAAAGYSQSQSQNESQSQNPSQSQSQSQSQNPSQSQTQVEDASGPSGGAGNNSSSSNSSLLPQIRGPPVEDWENHADYMAGLRAWYRSLRRLAREKLEIANQRVEEMQVPNEEISY